MNEFTSINPSTGHTIATYRGPSEPQIEAMLADAVVAQRAWDDAGHEARAGLFRRFADLLDGEADALALLAAQEMGKPVSEGRAEAKKCAALCRHYAENGAQMFTPQRHEIEGGVVELVHQPLGVVFSVTPWNFPFWQIMRAAIPALTAGNVVLNKPASNVIGCAERLIALATESGFPDGALQTTPLSNEQSARIMRDDRICGVALTGSEKAGASVAATAGEAIKKVVLELGGSDPFIVLADADIAAAARAAADSRFKNAGQVCVATKRIIVEEEVRETFTEAFMAETERYVPGDPTEEATMLGPMARGDLRDDIAAQVRASIQAGARVLREGGREDGTGYFYAPTVLADAPEESAAMAEETFGPCAAIAPVRDADAAIALANRSRFGLSSNLWTTDLDRAAKLARRIEAGSVFVNSTTASDPRFPFGGIKKSGFGRELGTAGAQEFTNLKTIRLMNP